MIDPKQKSEILAFITASFGIKIGTEQWFELEAKIKNMCLELHISDWEQFALSIPSLSPKSNEMSLLASQLSVGETYFFREMEALNLFKEKILPTLLEKYASQKAFNIWSAGCCSGEEPYTLAMILRENIPNIDDWEITIKASDINPRFIAKARSGLYTPWSFRNTPDWAMKKYFKKRDNGYQIDESIRNMVDYSCINLIDESAFPSANIKASSIDLIFCRNVFIYFSTEHIRNIAQRFKQCLTEQGSLITSPVEVSNEGLSCLKYIWYPGVGILRKDSAHQPESVNTMAKPSHRNKIDSLTAIHRSYTPPKHKRVKRHQELAKHSLLQLIGEARKAFDEGQYCIASRHIKSILSRNRNHPEALMLQAKIFANLGDLNGAIVILKNLLKTDNNNANFHYLLAAMYAEVQNHSLAEKSLRQALYIQPKMISAQLLMGNIMQSQGNTKAANKHFSHLKELLSQHSKEEVLPELDGMTAGGLSEIINCLVV